MGLSVMAGPATIVLIHLRQARKEPDLLFNAFQKLETEQVQTFKELPRHWLHALSGMLLLAMPLAQWIAYTSYRTTAAFLLPLIALIVTFVMAGILRPRVAYLQPPKHREWAINGGLLTLALIIAFVMPATGAVLILRAVLIDVLSLTIAAYGLRLCRSTVPI